MFIHAELQMAQFHQRESELIAEVEQHRLLAAVRRHRRQRGVDAGSSPATLPLPAGTLAGCGPPAAEPAR